ncbi:hypothetical protein L195_g036487 [Trifolium pratense]|uniref:Uncharacterized protein n=1 Tax=Trifolium pratense TaxID=57577 RepID=A0A2K3LPL9_TRIPR|nr:hypothetical protein L195_g036487 [Trifolium pratense]
MKTVVDQQQQPGSILLRLLSLPSCRRRSTVIVTNNANVVALVLQKQFQKLLLKLFKMHSLKTPCLKLLTNTCGRSNLSRRLHFYSNNLQGRICYGRALPENRDGERRGGDGEMN